MHAGKDSVSKHGGRVGGGRTELLDRGVYKIEGRTSCDGDIRVRCGVDVHDRDVTVRSRHLGQYNICFSRNAFYRVHFKSFLSDWGFLVVALNENLHLFLSLQLLDSSYQVDLWRKVKSRCCNLTGRELPVQRPDKTSTPNGCSCYTPSPDGQN